MGKLRNTLVEFWAKAQRANNIHDYEAAEKRIAELYLAVIGPSEKVEYHGMPDVITRNNLRDELREKVKEL